MTMNRVQTFVRSNLTSLLLLFLAGGFLILLAELLLTDHTEGIQLIAVAASTFGALLALAGLKAKGSVRNVLAILFLVLAISGLVGAFEHFEERFEEEEETKAPIVLRQNSGRMGMASIPYRLDQDEDEEDEEEEEESPPPLAPLSLSGLSILAALALLAKEEETS